MGQSPVKGHDSLMDAKLLQRTVVNATDISKILACTILYAD